MTEITKRLYWNLDLYGDCHLTALQLDRTSDEWVAEGCPAAGVWVELDWAGVYGNENTEKDEPYRTMEDAMLARLGWVRDDVEITSNF